MLFSHDKKLTDDIFTYFKGEFEGIIELDRSIATQYLTTQKYLDRIKELKKNLKLSSLKGKRILEIGSGLGLMNYYLRKEGAEAYGIEPDDGALNISHQINGKVPYIKKGVGEKIEHKDNFFDIVVSFQVLEHVVDPEKVLRESMRVLKKGGFLHFNIPNYNCFWEGHYGAFWIPNILKHKSLATLYVKYILRRKNTDYLNSLQNITPQSIEEIIAKIPDAQLITTGEKLFYQHITNRDYQPKWGSSNKLIAIKKVINALWLDRIIGKIFIFFKWHYPITLIVVKD